MNIYKKFILLALLIPLPFVFALLTLLYIYDPFMFFHKPYFRDLTYHGMRFQAKGVIDYNEFDSVILGTSMLENTSAKEASDKLGGKWVNLSLGGSYFNERAVILEYLFKKKELKNVIYSLDSFTLNLPKTKKTHDFDFIYMENNFLKTFGIYLDSKFIICALTYSDREKCVGSKRDLENLMKWILEDKYQKLFGGLENWLKNPSNNHYTKQVLRGIINYQDLKMIKDINLDKEKTHVKKFLLSYIEQNPQIKFWLIIPSYHVMTYKMNYDKNYKNDDFMLFSKYKTMLKWLIKESQKYPNVKIYGFDNLSYNENIANYKDPTHYNVDMNSMHLDAIASKTHILTPENMDQYFEIWEEKIRKFDIEPLKKQILEFRANTQK